MLPSLAALSLAPVNGTRAAQLPVGAPWKSGTTDQNTWTRGGMFLNRPSKYANDIARRLWGNKWHEEGREERLALAKRILEKIHPRYATNRSEPVVLSKEDMERFVVIAMQELGITTTVVQNDSSSEEDVPLSKRQPKRATTAPQPSLLQPGLPTEFLEIMIADAVLMSLDPCQRITEICASSRTFSVLCDNDAGVYDLLNKRLGWYGPYGSMAEIQSLSLLSAFYSHHKVSPKSWFLFCCGLYKKYGENYWFKQRHGMGTPTVHEIGLLNDGHWILNAVANSYKVYAKVADSIEEKIERHFGAIKKTLDEGDSEDWFHDGDLTYALGAFDYRGKFEELLKSDAKLSVLRNAMEKKPSGEWAEANMPMGFYTIIYNSKELVKILRAHSPTEIENDFSVTVEKLFSEASLVNTSRSWFESIDGGNVAWDKYPRETLAFMKELLITWLYLPTLQKYVFDTGDPDAWTSGNDLHYWGYFRLRKQDEEGIEVEFDDEVWEEDDDEEGEESDDEEGEESDDDF